MDDDDDNGGGDRGVLDWAVIAIWRVMDDDDERGGGEERGVCQTGG